MGQSFPYASRLVNQAFFHCLLSHQNGAHIPGQCLRIHHQLQKPFLADAGMRAAVEDTLRSTYYNETVERWLDEAEIVFYPENF